MADELTIRKNGAAEMAYVGAHPWHGRGTQLAAGASIEQWQAAAGMNWHVRRALVRYFADCGADEPEQMLHDASRTVLFRSDTLAPLGIVSPDYQIVHPGAILEFFRDLVGDAGYVLETAGTLFGGRKFWALAKVAEGSVGVAEDRVGGYVLLSTSTDGTMATEARETTVRVVCNNTLSMARRAGAAGAIKIGHRETFNARKVKDAMGLSRENFDSFLSVADALARVKVTDAAAQDYVRRLLRPDEAKQAAVSAEVKQAASIAAASGSADFAALLGRPHVAAPVVETEEKTKRAPRGEGAILELFRSTARGSNMASADGTAWGLVNAVTEYVDHAASAKSPDHRIASAWYGAGDALKSEALALAQTL